jgi:hypothetical protein
MLREDDTPVIIDFNTTQREERSGDVEELMLESEEMEFAVPENDFYGLTKFEKPWKMGRCQIMRSLGNK